LEVSVSVSRVRFWHLTVGFALLGAVGGGIYGGVTWHPVCSPDDFMPLFCSRGDLIALNGFYGLIVGAFVGLLAWMITMAASTADGITSRPAVRSQQEGVIRMAFLFKLETKEGLAAEPPTLSSAVPNWRAGDTIPLGRRALRVVAVRDDEADQPPVLVVEDADRGSP
jgi:hypothetical protein